MKKRAIVFLITILLALLLSSCGKTASSNKESSNKNSSSSGELKEFVTIREINKNPDQYKDRLVTIRGYGTIVATMPLPKGYVGLDTRCRFIDENNDKIVAKFKEEFSDVSKKGIYKEGKLRNFKGYIRIFEGNIGPPGSVRYEKIPWFEIVEVKE